jgi:hypothetical protein
MNETSRYAALQAASSGRVSGYEHVLSMIRYPLSSPPKNPYARSATFDGNKAMSEAWQIAFDESVAKHRKPL